MKKTQKQLEMIPQNQEEICECGHEKELHYGMCIVGNINVLDSKKSKRCPCKKFTPKTGKYGDKGRAKNHSSTEAEKLDEMPDYETTSQDKPSGISNKKSFFNKPEGIQNQEEICANCGRTKERHHAGKRATKNGYVRYCYNIHGYRTTKKFTPKTGKYGDKGRPKDHSQKYMLKKGHKVVNPTDKPSDNLCMQVSEGIHSQENPNGIGKRGNAFSPGTQNQEKGCGEQISDGSFEKVYCGKQRKIHLCPTCQEEKEK